LELYIETTIKNTTSSKAISTGVKKKPHRSRECFVGKIKEQAVYGL